MSSRLVVVSGWTGAGKSTVADAVAARLDATVVSFDWVMSGLRAFDDVWPNIEEPVERQRSIGWSLMSRVIEQQLRRGASVVADLVARDVVVDEWRLLAAKYEAPFSVIECLCTDPVVHRSRIEGRDRDIPGWYELTWERVERGRQAYQRLSGSKLVLDAMNPVSNNVQEALSHIGLASSSSPEEVIHRFFTAMQDREWAAAGSCLSPDITVRFSETNEVFRGENFLAFQQAYPDGWNLQIVEVIATASRVAVQVTVDQDDTRFWCAGFYTVADGLIVEGVEHWVTEGATTPPPWRLAFTE
jgi:predicted kinase